MPQNATGQGPTRLDGVRVLVVDDSPVIRGLVSEILQRLGAEVTAVSSAIEALGVLQRERPAVLVSDIAMPEHDGYWLISQVRALAPESGGATPALALSGETKAEDRARLLRAGFQFHLPKPCRPADLAGVVAILALTQSLAPDP